MDTTSLDRDVRVLGEHKTKWLRISLQEKISCLTDIVRRTVSVSGQMVDAAVRAKGIPAGPLEAEEWAGPYCIVRYANRLIATLTQLDRSGRITIGDSSIRRRTNGQLAIRVFPATVADNILFRGFRAEVWMCRGATRENLSEHMASAYRLRQAEGKVALVLGAGNVSSIGPLDVLTKLYVEGQVCLLKLSPVNEYLGPFMESFFAGLIRDGFVRIVRGGADVGEYLCAHPGISEIHVTGSHATHDAIVFGTGSEGEARKRAGAPRLGKRVTSELGNVSPIIVVPGAWSPSDIRTQAANIATQMVNNAGFNCCASKVLVLPESWPESDALMNELRRVLSMVPQRRAYYPGAEDRYDRFVGGRKAEAFGARNPGVLPWTLLPGLDPDESEDLCYRAESFCGVMAQTSLPGSGPADFLRRAVDFCNNRLWGTLSGCILVDPRTMRDLGPDLENAIAQFRYGSIGINQWPMLTFALGSTTWGAFPGHDYRDIQSGMGVVHNAMLFDDPERSVIIGPFRPWPKPAWFVTNRKSHHILPALLKAEAAPGLRNLAAVIFSSIGG